MLLFGGSCNSIPCFSGRANDTVPCWTTRPIVVDSGHIVGLAYSDATVRPMLMFVWLFEICKGGSNGCFG